MAYQSKPFFQLLREWLSNLLNGIVESRLPHINTVPIVSVPSVPEPSHPGINGIQRVIPTGTISARFHDTGSSAWKNQWPGTPMAGQHGGLDISAPQGTAVYAPYAMQIIAIGEYTDAGRKGKYVIGYINSDPTVEYYSGHLQNVKVRSLSNVAAGTELGATNDYNHTHIQMKRAGVLIDPETYLNTH